MFNNLRAWIDSDSFRNETHLGSCIQPFNVFWRQVRLYDRIMIELRAGQTSRSRLQKGGLLVQTFAGVRVIQSKTTHQYSHGSSVRVREGDIGINMTGVVKISK
jgi:hypothetical protein